MKTCPVCGKKPIRTIKRKLLRGNYNPTCKKVKYPNLQWVRLAAGIKLPQELEGWRGQRIKACAKCIKKLYK